MIRANRFARIALRIARAAKCKDMLPWGRFPRRGKSCISSVSRTLKVDPCRVGVGPRAPPPSLLFVSIPWFFLGCCLVSMGRGFVWVFANLKQNISIGIFLALQIMPLVRYACPIFFFFSFFSVMREKIRLTGTLAPSPPPPHVFVVVVFFVVAPLPLCFSFMCVPPRFAVSFSVLGFLRGLTSCLALLFLLGLLWGLLWTIVGWSVWPFFFSCFFPLCPVFAASHF